MPFLMMQHSSTRSWMCARSLRRLGTLLLLALLGVGGALEPHTTTAAPLVKRSDLEIVDCLLPGQLRQLGNMSFLTRRRPAQISASECWIRGGEYVAYDRADLKSSLAIWMETAQAGDAEAQTNVAEIYERGLGVEPNHEMAVLWYQKAADQGYSRALFNLGTLYEQGLGVPQDALRAMNLYREASGIAEDDLIYASAAERKQQELRSQLEEAIAEKDGQIGLLKNQVKTLENAAAKPAPRAPAEAPKGTDQSDQVKALWRWIAKLESERQRSSERLASLPRLRAPQRPVELSQLPPTADEQSLQGLNFGRYYAVVIGNQNYQAMDDLVTPRNDARRITRILRDKYRFSVKLIEDADDMDMLRTLNDLNAVLRPEDNLLIYYAGHGERVATGLGENGYWLPVNADAPPKDTFWVPNEQITIHLRRLVAKRILVVADSCYAGLLSNDPGYLFLGENMKFSREYVAFRLPKRSRMLLSSGGDRPVLDEGSRGNSVFAGAFADELEANTGVLSTPELYVRIRTRVQQAAAQRKFVQEPQFKAIKSAGHEVGDFFFVAVQPEESTRITKTAAAVQQ